MSKHSKKMSKARREVLSMELVMYTLALGAAFLLILELTGK